MHIFIHYYKHKNCCNFIQSITKRERLFLYKKKTNAKYFLKWGKKSVDRNRNNKAFLIKLRDLFICLRKLLPELQT